MQKKSILITGCSTGIGYYCAHALDKDGFHVIASARKAEDVARLKEEGLNTVQLDLNDSASIKEAVKQTLELSGGKLYGLFNNGAYGQPGAVEDLSREVLEEQFSSNVFGTHELTTLILPIMRKQGYGRIVQNSSVLGLISLRFRGAYNASKYALEGLSDTLRLELNNSGVFVSLIEPGPIKSDFRKNALRKFLEHIDAQNSVFKDAYKIKLKGLQSTEDAPFTLDEKAVYKRLLHALSAKHPKAHYRVTFPTSLFWFLKRILPTSWLDKVMLKAD